MMKKKYVQPLAESLEMTVEAIIATSMNKSADRAGKDFQELGNKKDFENPIWK